MIEDVNSYSHPPGKYSDSELQAIKDLLEVMIFFIDDTPHTNNKRIGLIHLNIGKVQII